MSDLSWLNPTPHTIAVYASSPLSPAATQHSLPSGRYPLLGPDFHRPDRTSLRLAHSLDHLVGTGEQRGRNFEAERPGRLQVDDELEFRRLQYRQVGGLGALEDLTGVGADLTMHARTIGVVAGQPAGFDSLARRIARGNPVTRRERRKLDAPAREEDITSDEQGVGAIAHEGGEGRLDLAAGAGVEDLNLQSHCTGGFRYVSYCALGSRVGRIDEHGDANGLGHQL